MAAPPPCTALGTHCRELNVTLRVADLSEDTPAFRDEMGTWLLGHTQRLTFGVPFIEGDQLLVDATLHVPCRYYGQTPGPMDGRAACGAHGFEGPVPPASDPDQHDPKLGEGRFEIMHDGQVATLNLAPRALPRRSLPTLQSNPCAGAPCRTADGVRGGACCRDLVLDVALPDSGELEEALLRNRARPYVSKIARASAEIVECEIISACGYLEEDGVACALHDRARPDGQPAKPSICFDWPVASPDHMTHPGCRLAPKPRPRA